MKSILISIRPEWVAKILNGEKTIEIRKTAPKCDLPIDVYIYCTKAKNKRKFTKIIPPYVARRLDEAAKVLEKNRCPQPYRMVVGRHCFSDGKVVAKFRLEKIDCLRFGWEHNPYFSGIGSATCLSVEETKEYLNGKTGYLWHISDLEIFDEPRELDEFDYPNPSGIRNIGQRSIKGLPSKKHPPQSWCYVEEVGE